MRYLNNKLLNIEGLKDVFNNDVMGKDEPETPEGERRTPCLLDQFRKKLVSIYYPDKEVVEVNPALIEQDIRFSTYPELKQALTSIFRSDNKEEIKAQLDSIVLPALPTIEAHASWETLNSKLGYFEGDALFPLFEELAGACRAMNVLVEGSRPNEDNEDMHYISAYRLMALFVSQTQKTSFEGIAKKTYALLNQANEQQKERPYHDIILNRIQLPPRATLNDLSGWHERIQSKSGIAYLPYFAMAPQIEEHTGGKAPTSLAQAEVMATRCDYKKALENIELAELCRAYNIPEDGDECSFNKCLSYRQSLPHWPMKTTDNLPHPVTIGEGAAEGYCWVKLPTNDLRSLILGRMTACCQSIGGHSQQCVKDAINLSDNGLYVLLKRRDKAAYSSQPFVGDSINDADFEIVGQSYAWISKTGNLTLDSLECSKRRVPNSVAKALMTSFSETVLAENPSIRYITLGEGGGTPKDLGFSRVPIPEQIRQGHAYGDSSEQFCIARRIKIPDQEFDQSMTNLEIDGELKEALRYLSDYLPNTDHFEEELNSLFEEFPELKTKLNFKNLFRLLSLTSTPTLNDLRPVDWENLEKQSEPERSKALSGISLARMVWEDLTPDELLKRLKHISSDHHLTVIKAHPVLHLAEKNPDLLLTLVDMLPEAERYEVIKNSEGYKLLYNLAKENTKLLQSLLNKLPPDHRTQAILGRVFRGETISHILVKDTKLLGLFLNMLPEAKRIEAIKIKNSYEQTVLHSAASHTESLALLLNMLPATERLEALKVTDIIGRNVFTFVGSHTESLALLLKMLPATDRLEALKVMYTAPTTHIDFLGKTVLSMLLIKDPELLNMILSMLPEADRIEAIKFKDLHGCSILHEATKINNPKLLENLLNMLPEDALIEAITDKNNDGTTVFEMSNNTILEVILTALPRQSFKDLPKNMLDHPFVNYYLAKKTKEQFKAEKIVNESLNPKKNEGEDNNSNEIGKNRPSG